MGSAAGLRYTDANAGMLFKQVNCYYRRPSRNSWPRLLEKTVLIV